MIGEELVLFRKWMSNQDKAIKTIKEYSNSIDCFNDYLQKNKCSLLSFKKEDAINFIEEKNKESKSKVILNRYIASVNAYYEFKEENIRLSMKMLIVSDIPAVNSKKITIISKDVQDLMYKYANKTWKKRNISMILLILETGIKLYELVALNRDDLHVINDNPYVTIRGKISRNLPISEELYSTILKSYKTSGYSGESMFSSQLNNRCSRQATATIFSNYGLTSQILRDTYIYNLINSGVDTYNIAQLAGITTSDQMISKFYNCEYKFINKFLEVQN
ncbi:hypothetical protein GCM10011351_26870 [Paraliobacillus quinghaiensis]|uniref:Integrase n=1 Tax=Paraliobacillus quinghaiensis TaxID=470815 RepID=A0A917WYA7_9BACI|nr:site-specific integrase [Paraliobacillus quinghaiensis]GGM39339.1 hypothetical protein GCM10011351_26870 [Paraliobacillus quinghaiensis]